VPRTLSSFPPRPMPDYYTKHAAGLLCGAINAFWARKGAAHVAAEPFQIEGRLGWGVASNLVGGLPPVRAETRGRPAGPAKRVLSPRSEPELRRGKATGAV
jgi:hypothetical protein